MGQYHTVVNLTKKEYLDPHKFGDGLKLWEQVNSEGGTMVALFALLACSNGRGGGDLDEHDMIGRWTGDKIAVIGDYAENKDLPIEFKAGEINDKLESEYHDISDDILPVVENACDVSITGTGWRQKTNRKESEDI